MNTISASVELDSQKNITGHLHQPKPIRLSRDGNIETKCDPQTLGQYSRLSATNTQRHQRHLETFGLCLLMGNTKKMNRLRKYTNVTAN